MPSSSAFVASMIRLLRAPSPQRAAFGVGLAVLATALYLAYPNERLEPLPYSALGPFLAVAALIGRRAAGLAALAAAVFLLHALNEPDPITLDLILFVGKWLLVILVADVVHDLWLRAAENERVGAEEARLAQQRLELALESGAIGTFEADLVRNEIRLNEKNCEIFGWTSDRLVNADLLDTLVVKEDLTALYQARARALSGNGRFYARIRIRRANDGVLRWIDTHGQVYFERNAPVRVFGVMRDITDEMEAAASLEERASLAEQDRIRAEELVQAQRGLALALEAGAIGVGELDLRTGVVKVNSKLREIYGLGAADAVTWESLDRLVEDEDRAAYHAAIAQALDPRSSGQREQRFRIRRCDDGALRWVYTRNQVHFEDGVAVRVVGLMRDITDERAAEAALEEKARLAEQDRVRAQELALERRRLELALEAGAIGTFEVDLITGDIRLSEKHREISGWTSEQPLSLVVMDEDLVVDEDRAALHEARARATALHGDGRYAAQFRIRRANDGAIRWVDTRGQVYFDADAPVRVFGVTRDITDEKAAAAVLEEKAKLSEQLTRLAEALPGAIYTYVLPPDGNAFIPYVSPNVWGLLGFGPMTYQRELTRFWERIHPDDVARLAEAEQASARDLSRWTVLFRYNHPEKGEIWIEGDGQPLRREDGATVTHGYLQDVTARETSARALTESEARVRALKDERLAALEKLAAGLAHEVNQPLAAAATLLVVARRRLTSAPPDHESRAAGTEALQKAAHQILRAGQIITRVREFSQHGEADKTFRSLHETIHETLAQLEGDSSFSGFEFVLRLEAARDRVLMDRVQIAAVLTNLLRNAAQAALPGGRRAIVVATRNLRDNIEVSVIDYGSGLSEDAGSHLFELFWTTKGSGMGVGLAMSKAIVEAHYGTIWLQDDVEETMFTFSLPLTGAGDGPQDAR